MVIAPAARSARQPDSGVRSSSRLPGSGAVTLRCTNTRDQALKRVPLRVSTSNVDAPTPLDQSVLLLRKERLFSSLYFIYICRNKATPLFFFFNKPAPPKLSTFPHHDPLPI